MRYAIPCSRSAAPSPRARRWSIPSSCPARLISKDDLVRNDPRKLARVLIALIYRLRLFGRGMQFFDYFFMRAGMKKLYKQK